MCMDSLSYSYIQDGKCVTKGCYPMEQWMNKKANESLEKESRTKHGKVYRKHKKRSLQVCRETYSKMLQTENNV